jgi:prepilin-type N-terminal cleavage/methylation domain-containing protein
MRLQPARQTHREARGCACPRPLQHPLRKGFTLVELLVAIGIIVILIAILIPTVSRVRYAAYAASTQQEISVIEAAVTAYHADFGAYPGPFSNDQIIGVPNVNSGAPTAIVSDALNNKYAVTMAENCVIGLAGGLQGNYTFDYNASLTVGTGPLSFNPISPKRYAPYISNATFTASNSMLSYDVIVAPPNPPVPTPTTMPIALCSQATTYSPVPAVSDSPLPEFMDKFPDQRPILYMRARVGAPGIISSYPNPTYPSTTTYIPYQYDLAQITPYMSTALWIPNTNAPTNGYGPNFVEHPLNGLGFDVMPLGAMPPNGAYTLWSSNDSPPTAPPTQAIPTPDAIRYFMSWSTPPTNPADINTSGTPRSKDGYILISAGKDGLFGTYDDIASFGAVQQ